MKATGRKIGPQRSSLFATRKRPPKRQTFPEWMLTQELKRIEEAKRKGHRQ